MISNCHNWLFESQHKHLDQDFKNLEFRFPLKANVTRFENLQPESVKTGDLRKLISNS